MDSDSDEEDTNEYIRMIKEYRKSKDLNIRRKFWMKKEYLFPDIFGNKEEKESDDGDRHERHIQNVEEGEKRLDDIMANIEG